MGFAYSCLSYLMSHTDAIGYLGIGKMHVLSPAQFSFLVEPYLDRFEALLDIGKPAAPSPGDP
jgi:hypothetical protein